MQALPNILTGIRLALSVMVFLALCMAAGAIPGIGAPAVRFGNTLLIMAFLGFMVAAVTDFFDGWIARKYNAESVAGAILDPIADKILVCGALIGLIVIGAKAAALPAGIILFREFAVSAMREVLAPRGIKLPVTFLAKTKTTLQLVAIAAILALPLVAGYLVGGGRAQDFELLTRLMFGAYGLLWLAAAVTLWTGIEYALAARRALSAKA